MDAPKICHLQQGQVPCSETGGSHPENERLNGELDSGCLMSSRVLSSPYLGSWEWPGQESRKGLFCSCGLGEQPSLSEGKTSPGCEGLAPQLCLWGALPQCLAALQILSYTSGKASWQPSCFRSLWYREPSNISQNSSRFM